MKKRTAFFCGILSLLPLGHPLMIKTGVVLSGSALMLSLPEKVNAESFNFYFDRAYEKGDKGDHYGAISDFTKAIEINPNRVNEYINRGRSFYSLNDEGRACEDFKKAVFLGSTSTEEWLNSEGGSWCRNI